MSESMLKSTNDEQDDYVLKVLCADPSDTYGHVDSEYQTKEFRFKTLAEAKAFVEGACEAKRWLEFELDSLMAGETEIPLPEDHD
jgi:hypothetical protein